MKAPRADTATIRRRVHAVLQVMLDGAQPFEVRQWVSEKQCAGEPPWTIPDGGKRLSERQIRRYVRQAESLIAESYRTSRKKLLRLHTAQRRSILARAIQSGDLRTALATLDSLAKLQDVRPAEPTPKESRIVTSTADVVKLLGERLGQVDAADLPTAERAKLTATLADAMLRAIGVDVLDKRLEALQAVLIGRKEKP